MNKIKKGAAICVVPSCPFNKYIPKANRHFYKFPKSESLFHQWINAIKLRELIFENINCYRICDLHFDDRDFTTPAKVRLNYNAIPKIFLTRS